MMRIFIHSWHGDFARTEIAADRDDRAPARETPPQLRPFACGCGTQHLQRMRRSTWMRLVFGFRLYLCLRCGAHVFRLRTGQRPYYPGF